METSNIKHLYIGTFVQVTRTGAIRKFVGMNRDYVYLEGMNGKTIRLHFQHECRQVLRPLSDITASEIVEYRRLQGIPDVPTEIRTQGFTPAAMHYLLSRGFDLFNRLDNGHAVDARMLSPNPYY
jgi:hypothetical protein